MKTLTLGFAAALALGLASFTAPASAMTAAPAVAVTHGAPGITAVRYIKRTVVRRRGPHCVMRKVVQRGPHGRRVVRTRVCH